MDNNPIQVALNNLRAVLCDPSGRVVIAGSDSDRAIAQSALAALDEASVAQAQQRAGWRPDREAVAATCSRGWVQERDRMHGGGFRVIWQGKECPEIYKDEDTANDMLCLLRADAILALRNPNAE